jgi:hypothetical protein
MVAENPVNGLNLPVFAELSSSHYNLDLTRNKMMPGHKLNLLITSE